MTEQQTAKPFFNVLSIKQERNYLTKEQADFLRCLDRDTIQYMLDNAAQHVGYAIQNMKKDR